MKCPKCGLINPDTAIRCDCGYDFPTGKMKESFLPQTKSFIYPQQIKGTEGYPVLNILSTVYKFLACICFFVSVIAAVLILEEGSKSRVIPGILLLSGITLLIFFLSISETIRVFIDIEDNTSSLKEILDKILNKLDKK